MPLTTTRTDGGEPHEGWSFTVRTTLGPVRLDDSMVVAEWEPPLRWRVHKTGPIHGWAEGVVSPSGAGSRLTWTEELWFGGKLLSPLTRRVGDVVGPLLFGPVVRRIATVTR
ncbi:hypothetical protein N803_02965 [Knoellia subterranea KCTC 19937]|uniref:Polyketide cyclase n=1 Tax=Knoellia subterranea KCTC 19937 TaxID=1385521 RepID=A0A0A0JPQ8_9MICO|nr:hypothetical protein N803_02965 [Knoellia subterranea KCTC 19937]